MGHLFSSRGPAQDVVIDFDSVLKDVSNVANEDRQLFEEIGACLGDAEAALEQLINYEDRANMIRRAISTPSDSQLQMQAFEDVFPNVIYIKRVHELTERIAVLLKDACARIVRDGDEAFEQKSGLVARVAELLHFSLEYDIKKMTTPAIQNDFAFYKRSLSKFGTHPDLPLRENEASVVSMFVANANPIAKSLKAPLDDDQAVRRALLLLANSCCGMINGSHVEGRQAEWVAKVMTAAVVIYDELGYPGAFVKASDLQIRSIIRAVGTVEHASLLRAQLQYNTETFNNGHISITRLLRE